jgi:hypothetical protein
MTVAVPMIIFLEKIVILIAATLAFGIIGWAVPLMFDRDVAGALASELLGTVGLIVGGVFGGIIIRRRFD